MAVSLEDTLDSLGPLTSEELWTVLCQGATAIQDLFFRGEYTDTGDG